jgi:hypothetical protein
MPISVFVLHSGENFSRDRHAAETRSVFINGAAASPGSIASKCSSPQSFVKTNCIFLWPICMPMAMIPRRNDMYSANPSFSRTDWNRRAKHVAIMAFPCSQQVIPAVTFLFRDSIDFTRWEIDVMVRSLSSVCCARSEADNASMECRRKSY